MGRACATDSACWLGHACNRMFELLAQFVQLQDDAAAPAAPAAADHYLYFRGVPNPPDDYMPPIGASPNT